MGLSLTLEEVMHRPGSRKLALGLVPGAEELLALLQWEERQRGDRRIGSIEGVFQQSAKGIREALDLPRVKASSIVGERQGDVVGALLASQLQLERVQVAGGIDR